MTDDHDPRIDPQAGDSVIARIGDQYVTRTVRAITQDGICYDDSRRTKWQICWFTTWQDWCRKNKAEVVRDEK
jgi:hypothetical protein